MTKESEYALLRYEHSQSELRGAKYLALALGYTTGFAKTYEHLVEHVKKQVVERQQVDAILEHVATLETKIRHFEEERRLWQAVARTVDIYRESGGGWGNVIIAIDAVLAAGLTWEEML